MARALYGAALLLRPGPLLAAAGGDARSSLAKRVARVLGLRHLLQAAAVMANPTVDRLRLGALADSIHAITMLGLAAVKKEARRPALADAGVELSLAAAGALEARRR